MRWLQKSSSRIVCRLRKLRIINVSTAGRRGALQDGEECVTDTFFLLSTLSDVLDGMSSLVAKRLLCDTDSALLVGRVVDGNGWSSRFSRLLMSGSVVIKHTLFPEWHHVRLTEIENV
jgi:hypothetical protein